MVIIVRVVRYLFLQVHGCARNKFMPVNILDIPAEAPKNIKTPSLWIWGCLLVLTVIVYAAFFLGFFSSFLSKNPYIFWSELLLIPFLLWGGVFCFRLLLWNSQNLEISYWNSTRENFYQELLKKGRVNFDIVDVMVKFPNLDGAIKDQVNNSLVPVRYTPKDTHMARYLAFKSAINNCDDKEQCEDRAESLSYKMIPDLLDELYVQLNFLPENTKIKILCSFSSRLQDLLKKFWLDRIESIFPFLNIQFCNNLSESLDAWLDEEKDEHLIIIASRLYDDELITDYVDNQSEALVLLFGKKNFNTKHNRASLGGLYRPEIDWEGVGKSLIWGGISPNNRLSGVLYSGLSDKEKNDIVLKTSNVMSDDALMSFNYINTDDFLCLCPPVTEFLQIKYAKEYLEAGHYLLVNKHQDSLVSYFFTLNADERNRQ
ncbi:hypothetical protein C9426_34670 [Serratia sp. S1B]|nr:hypothetical protein C9426_34670 [Serratia sp. S1B]